VSNRPYEERRSDDRVRFAHILVVDDSSTIRRILAGTLEKAGYRVSQASDGSAGLEVCRAEMPDLVLLDVDMPVLDGRATLTAMKDDPVLADIPVLFLTAQGGGDDVAAGLELGAQDYLRKPCQEPELLARVNTALRMDQMRRQLEEQAAALEVASNSDPLTGLGNRRRFQKELPELIDDATGARVGFVLLDIDHFKRVNDTHGHVVGDVVIQILAQRLRGVVGPGGRVFRWGGEEFLVLAPDSDAPAIERLGEEVRAAVARSPFAIDDERTLDITVSVGCVTAPASDWEVAVHAADTAMYEAKAAGRNTVRLESLEH
jgi:two-component system cell cycle response regulator